jgi:hypothetical protein
MSELSESEFQSIVNAALADRSRIVNVVATGFSVSFMVLSKSRKQRWQAGISFDPRTGESTGYATYPSSTELRSFASEIARRIKER